MTQPFAYPSEPLVRRHGPRGYSDHAGFKPWLRDEFSFRCVFCLDRESWQKSTLEVDHFESAALAPDRALDYDNLLYACRTCNGMKAATAIPDPCRHLLSGSIIVQADGSLKPKSLEAERIIEQLALNAERHREYRFMWMRVIETVREHDPMLFRSLMEYPLHLPELERLRPPGGNAKPEGLATSYHARRLRGELPETY